MIGATPIFVQKKVKIPQVLARPKIPPHNRFASATNLLAKTPARIRTRTGKSRDLKNYL
ncbi:hypothetical protein [Legionella drozanskii]|uniref:hypothetical protein n=1 Tax=Legionella drozanskii TaxID=96228 RepID=UPI0012EEB1A4|nr:hypothetical protein [Legionella drozanskii]